MGKCTYVTYCGARVWKKSAIFWDQGGDLGGDWLPVLSRTPRVNRERKEYVGKEDERKSCYEYVQIKGKH
jgi:hypothetical protein